MVPKSLLNQLRRELVARLDASAATGPDPDRSPPNRSCPRSWPDP